MKTTTKLCTLLLVLSAAAGGHAEVLIDNLDQDIRNPANLTNNRWSAQSFITAGGEPVVLNLVTLRLGVMFDDPNIVAELRADGAGSGPGSLLTTFTVPALVGGPTQNEMLTPNDVVTLMPATSYWLVLGVNGGGGYDWSYAAGNAASGSGSFGEYAYTLDQGSSWIVQGLEDPYMARIEVSPVPDASPAATLALGLVVLGWLGRRRRG